MKKQAAVIALLVGFSAAAWAAPRTVATVNGKPITADQLTKRLWWQHAAQGLSEMIDEQLLLDEAAVRKVKADAGEVTARIDALRANYKNAGEFEQNLKSVNWSIEDLKTLLRNQILMRNTIIAAGNIAMTDAEAKDFYDKNTERFFTPESAKLLQIFVNTKAEADTAYEALSAGADFSKLSSLKSADENLKKNGGNLGYISRGMLQPDIEKEIFALKPGQYTKPVATGNGYSLLKMEESKPPQKIAYDAAKENIKTSFVNQAITKEMPKFLAELRAKAKLEIQKQ